MCACVCACVCVCVCVNVCKTGGVTAASPVQPEDRTEPETTSMALRPLPGVPSPPLPDVKFRSNSPPSLRGSHFEEAPYLEIIDDDDDHGVYSCSIFRSIHCLNHLNSFLAK